MRYFHRTHVSPDAVLEQAAGFFGTRLVPAEESQRRRAFTGSIGRLTVSAKPEAGHYTYVTVETDQVGESEVDKLAKRFLAEVHAAVEPGYQVRGAY